MKTDCKVVTAGITHTGIVTCLGQGRAEHVHAIRKNRSGLKPPKDFAVPFGCLVGEVSGLADLPFPEHLSARDNRANRLALLALKSDGLEGAVRAAKAKWGADRCAVILGTSSSGMDTLEHVYRALGEDEEMPKDYVQENHDSQNAVTEFVREYLGFDGVSYSISTACSSSAKAIVDAFQLIQMGICDAVLTGGVDSLCLTSLAGFESLELISRSPCKPCDINRDGLSIGEAAGFLLVQRDQENCIRLRGYGESSDGTSMSTPPKDGAGAAAAMRQALERGGVRPKEVGWVNLHGTATPANDVSEACAVTTAVDDDVPASSLKGAIGHTLGAAGAVEAIVSMFAISEGIVPGNTGLETLDPDALQNVSAECRDAELNFVLSNSFGFGGSNCALVLGY